MSLGLLFSEGMKSSGGSVFQSVKSSSLVVLSLAGLGRLLISRLLASRMLTSLREKSDKMVKVDASHLSADGEYYCKNGDSVSIRQSVFEKLDENPSLRAKSL